MTSESSWEPVRRVRTHEQVLAQIERRILDGRLRVGEKLPSERDLVDALGVSRTSVREALRALEAMGIIEANVGSGRDAGSVVSGRSTEALGNLLRLHMALAEIPIGELVEIRVQLEGPAAEAAARHATPEEVERLGGLVADMRATDLPYERFSELDTEFHVTIARISRNVLAADLMQALREAVRAEMAGVFNDLPDWRRVAAELADEHEAIVSAIRAGDGPAAARLVAEHIDRFYRDRVRPA